MQAVSTQRIEVSADDAQRFTEILQEGHVTLKAEQFDRDRYLERIVEKPWGWEYRIYADNFYDVWKLSLRPGQSTSLHCHPRKETALLCLSGRATMQSLGKIYTVGPMDMLHIGKGVFHSTENSGDSLLELIEVETPRNKLDLIRSADKYGREGRSYERQGADHGEHVMKDGMLVQGSKLRRDCIARQYHFGIRAGMDIICNPKEPLLFVVSLSVMDAISHDIRVFPGDEIEPEVLDPENLYFTISQNE